MIDLKKKKIIVTGGGGFLGTVLVQMLTDDYYVPADSIFVPRSREYDLRIEKGRTKLFKDFPADVIIHLAADVGGIAYNIKNAGSLFYNNIMMGVGMMEAARQHGVEKFVGIGTVCSYPKFTPVPFKETDLWKGYPEESNAPYGLSKLMTLVQAQTYRTQYGFNAIHLLPVNLYGPGDDFDLTSSHVIPALIKKVYEAQQAKTQSISVWGSGKASREFLYVDDAARGIIKATVGYDKPEPVNLGAGMEITIKKLVETITKLMKFKGSIEWDTTKPDGQPRRCLDVARAKKEFGFVAKTSFKTGLKKTIEWYLKEQHHA